MMLPPLNSLPREGLVVFMAAEACLTARKQLVIGQRTQQANAEGTSRKRIYTHDFHELLRSDVPKRGGSGNARVSKEDI